jgi:hypothetical protein
VRLMNMSFDQGGVHLLSRRGWKGGISLCNHVACTLLLIRDVDLSFSQGMYISPFIKEVFFNQDGGHQSFRQGCASPFNPGGVCMTLNQGVHHSFNPGLCRELF